MKKKKQIQTPNKCPEIIKLYAFSVCASMWSWGKKCNRNTSSSALYKLVSLRVCVRQWVWASFFLLFIREDSPKKYSINAELPASMTYENRKICACFCVFASLIKLLRIRQRRSQWVGCSLNIQINKKLESRAENNETKHFFFHKWQNKYSFLYHKK